MNNKKLTIINLVLVLVFGIINFIIFNYLHSLPFHITGGGACFTNYIHFAKNLTCGFGMNIAYVYGFLYSMTSLLSLAGLIVFFCGLFSMKKSEIERKGNEI